MKKPRYYYNRTYRADFYYFIGWKEKDVKKYCVQTFGVPLDISTSGGLTVECHDRTGHPMVLIWLEDKTDLGSLAHECNHAAAFTLQRVGVKASYTNDEPFTYLSQDLFSFAVGE